MLKSAYFKTLRTSFCLLMTAIVLLGCEDSNPLDIPVPNNGVEVKIERLDQAWFEMSAVEFRERHPQWTQQYGELYQRYIEDVLHLGSIGDSNLFTSIRRFTTDPAIAEVQDSVHQHFSDLDELSASFSDAWSYYTYYFPDARVPVHFSFIGGFNTPAILTENGVGIGLEMFLGSESVFYEYLQLPVYLRKRMSSEHIVPTVFKGWVSTEYPLTQTNPTLLAVMIQEGKTLYVLDALMPRTPAALKIGYSEQEVTWAKEHQQYVWAHFIDNDLLFSSNSSEIAKFNNDGPFTVDLVKESPPRMGHYIGWQIVKAYMERQKNIDLPSLMQMDAEEILKQSKYKP